MEESRFHEWTPCEVQEHRFLNEDADPCAPGEAGRCADCGEPLEAD